MSAQPKVEKPSVITEKPTPTTDPKTDSHDDSQEKTQVHPEARRHVSAAPIIPNGDSLLHIISTRLTLQGSMCNYVVDSENGSIEMVDGLISGLLDRETIQRFIAELQEAYKMLG